MTKVEKLQLKVMQELDLSKEVEDDELMETIRCILTECEEGEYLSLQEKASLGKELFNTFRKWDILQELLEDETVTEIMVNGTDHIFVEKEGQLLSLEKRFGVRERLEDLIQQMVAGANRMVNEASPIVDARLPDGSRVNVVLYPVAINGPIVTIRKFPKEPMTMQDLILRQSINCEIDTFLRHLMIARYNIFISGGTGSG